MDKLVNENNSDFLYFLLYLNYNNVYAYSRLVIIR